MKQIKNHYEKTVIQWVVVSSPFGQR